MDALESELERPRAEMSRSSALFVAVAAMFREREVGFAAVFYVAITIGPTGIAFDGALTRLTERL